MLQRGEDFVADDLVKALGRRGEGLEVGVVQGPHRRMVEHLPVGLAEHQIDGVGRGAIGERLARKKHTVARKARFEAALGPIAAAVAQLGDDIRAGILMEGGFEMRLLAAAGIQAQEGPHMAQTPQFEHAGQGARQGIQELVDDERVEFVGEGPRLPIVVVVRHVPAAVEFPLGVGPMQVDGDAAMLGEVMNGEARQHRLRPQDAEGFPCRVQGEGGVVDVGDRVIGDALQNARQSYAHTRLSVSSSSLL